MKRSRLLIFCLGALLLVQAGLPEAWAGAPQPQSETEVEVSSAVCRALSWLDGQQMPDGGFGVAGGKGSVANATADAVYALALLGEDPSGPRWTTASGVSLLAALEELGPAYVGTDAGQAGKVARAVARAGGDPRDFGGSDLIGIITAQYDPATGRYHPSLSYRHTLAVEALLLSGEGVPPEAISALQQVQLGDGGWFWSFDAAVSDVDATGRVLQLLAGSLGVADPAAYASAVEFLDGSRLAGGWNTGVADAPPNANSTALALGGILAAGLDPNSPRFQTGSVSALDALLSFQEPSGAFVYIREPGKEEMRVMATLDALVALASLAEESLSCSPPYLPLLLQY